MNSLVDNVIRIIDCLGGRENIVSATNCMTRFRVVVKNEAEVDEVLLRECSDVLGLVHDRVCNYEVVVGPGKGRKYVQCCMELGIGQDPQAPGDAAKRRSQAEYRDEQKKNWVNYLLKVVGDIFIPLLPGVITAGLCAGFASLISQVVPDYADHRVWSFVYQILSLIQTSFMTYITAWAGYRAAERFGASPVLGGMLGMITSLDGINRIASLMGLYNEEVPLDSILRTGKGGVLAVIAGTLLISFVEKRIRAMMPDTLDMIFTPILTMLVCVIPYIVLIMPLFGYLSSGIVWVFGKACLSESILVRAVTGYIAAALFLPLVAAGMHHGLVALYSVQLQELGFVTLYPALAMAGAGQVGAAIALWRKAKRAGNKNLCSVIAGALPAGLLGVGEPLIYGVTLPLGKPFLTAGLGAGFGGAFAMIMQVASSTWGPSGLLGSFVMTAGRGGPLRSVLFYLLALVISYIGGYIITNLMFKDEELGTDLNVQKGKNETEGHFSFFSRAGKNGVRKIRAGESLADEQKGKSHGLKLCAPVTGELIPMEKIPDIVFSSGVIGDCVGVLPENGEIFAPCEGVVSEIADTRHAITFRTADGSEVILHIGIDTFSLGGKGFVPLVRDGDPVQVGSKIMEADLEEIKKAGLSPMVITILCNKV